MRRLFANKRASAWLGIIILWVVVFIITIAWPKTEWLIPATCFRCRMIREFETGQTIMDVFFTLIMFSTSVILFMLGRERRGVRVISDIATAFAGIQLTYLGVMRIWPDMLASDAGIILIAIDIISSFGIVCCVLAGTIVIIRSLRHENEGAEQEVSQ